MSGIDNFEFDFHPAYKNIIDGVNDALYYINDKNMSPTDAVIKSASTNNLNIQKTIRVSESVNKALTMKHLEKSSSDKRGDTFPIVDTSKIVLEMSGNLDKPSASEEIKNELMKLEKQSQVEDYKQKKLMKPIEIKIAGMVMDTDFGVLNEIPIEKEDLVAQSREIEDDISTLMDVYNYSSEKVASSMRNLEKEFNKLYHSNSSEFIKYALLNYSKYDNVLEEVFKNLSDRTSGFNFSTDGITKESMQIDFLDEKVSGELDSYIKHATMMGVSSAKIKLRAEDLDNVESKKKKLMFKEAGTGIPRGITPNQYQQMFNLVPVEQGQINPVKQDSSALKFRKNVTKFRENLPWTRSITPSQIASRSPFFSRMIQNAQNEQARDYETAGETKQMFSNFIGPMQNAIKRGRILQRLSMDPDIQGANINDIAKWYDSLHDMYPAVAENYEAAKPLMKSYAAAGGMLPLDYGDMQKVMENAMEMEKYKSQKDINLDDIVLNKWKHKQDDVISLRDKGIARKKSKEDKRREQLSEQKMQRQEQLGKQDRQDKKNKDSDSSSKTNEAIANAVMKARNELNDISKWSDQWSDPDQVKITNAKQISGAIESLIKIRQTPSDLKALSAQISKMSKGGRYNSKNAVNGLKRIADATTKKVEGAEKNLMTNLYGQYKNVTKTIGSDSQFAGTVIDKMVKPLTKINGLNDSLFSGVDKLMSSNISNLVKIDNINKKINANFKKFG